VLGDCVHRLYVFVCVCVCACVFVYLVSVEEQPDTSHKIPAGSLGSTTSWPGAQPCKHTHTHTFTLTCVLQYICSWTSRNHGIHQHVGKKTLLCAKKKLALATNRKKNRCESSIIPPQPFESCAKIALPETYSKLFCLPSQMQCKKKFVKSVYTVGGWVCMCTQTHYNHCHISC